MEVTGDLSAEALAAALPDRPLRTYPALLSTEADALSWARSGAPAGAVVVADYQASPRGRGGLVWTVAPGRGLAFSMVLRPRLSAEREGWLYTIATSGLAGVHGEASAIRWPDEVLVAGKRAAAIGVHAELGPRAVAWAVVNVLIVEAQPPRGGTLAGAVLAIEAAAATASGDLLASYLQRCETLGRRVCARLLPMGPAGRRVTGTAVTALKDGALVIETDERRRVAIRPQALGLLEDA